MQDSEYQRATIRGDNCHPRKASILECENGGSLTDPNDLIHGITGLRVDGLIYVRQKCLLSRLFSLMPAIDNQRAQK
jgi:hypothetical protein